MKTDFKIDKDSLGQLIKKDLYNKGQKHINAVAPIVKESKETGACLKDTSKPVCSMMPTQFQFSLKLDPDAILTSTNQAKK